MSQGDHGASDLYREIGVISGKLDILIVSLQDHVKKDEAAWSRISDLEKKVMYAAGIVSVFVGVVTTGGLAFLRKIFS